MNVLEHTEDLQRLLQEVQRVLKPGGVFAFHTINRSWCALLPTFFALKKKISVWFLACLLCSDLSCTAQRGVCVDVCMREREREREREGEKKI